MKMNRREFIGGVAAIGGGGSSECVAARFFAPDGREEWFVGDVSHVTIKSSSKKRGKLPKTLVGSRLMCIIDR